MSQEIERITAVLLLCFVATACMPNSGEDAGARDSGPLAEGGDGDGDGDGDGGGQPTDAGEEPNDAGEEPIDAGEQPTDAGEEPLDAGEEPLDAGEEPLDAGEQPLDAGEQPTDAGEEPLDAGEQPTDAAEEPSDAGEDPTDAGEDPTDAGEEPTDAGEGEPGNPLPDAPVGEWIYVEIEGMECRDGSPAGIGIRYAANSDLVALYMQGGGLCFNSFSCLSNPSSIDSDQFVPGPFGGLFDNENPGNPLADYNFIYFPYCTGDMFFGSEPNGNVPGGPQGQKFVGRSNVNLALERIADTFPNPVAVVATGESGGGFGAAFNYDIIASFFPDNDVVLIDDSGPLFRDQYFAPCLQQQWRDIWNVDVSLPQDCSTCFGDEGGGLYNYLFYIQDRYPNAPKGIISSHADNTNSSFFGFGSNNCQALFPSFPQFQEALYDMRDNVLTGPASGTYFTTGNAHAYLSGSSYYDLEVNGVLLVDWVADMMAGDAAHVAP